MLQLFAEWMPSSCPGKKKNFEYTVKIVGVKYIYDDK